jgi:hypothetical protein
MKHLEGRLRITCPDTGKQIHPNMCWVNRCRYRDSDYGYPETLGVYCQHPKLEEVEQL